MAEYIGSAQFGQPINFSAQKDGERYPSWINTDYSGLFDAIGESISGVVNAKKQALEKEKEEEKKNQAAYSNLIDKYFIDTPEAGDDSEYFLSKVTEYNDKAKSYIEGAISSGNNYLTPEQIVELKKLSNQILSEKNLSELNQQTSNQIRSKFFEADAQYEAEDFNKWMDGYNKQTTIQDKAKYIKNNERPLVPIVTLSDAAADLRKKNIGTKREKVGNTEVTVIDPELTEQGIDLMLQSDPNSDVAKYINKGATEEEKEKRRDDVVKMMGIQTDTKPYRASAAKSKPSSSSGVRNQLRFDTTDKNSFNANYIPDRGNSIDATIESVATRGTVSRIEWNGDKVTAIYKYKDPIDLVQKEIKLDYDNAEHKKMINSSLETDIDIKQKFIDLNKPKEKPKETSKPKPKETPKERAERIARGG